MKKISRTGSRVLRPLNPTSAVFVTAPAILALALAAPAVSQVSSQTPSFGGSLEEVLLSGSLQYRGDQVILDGSDPVCGAAGASSGTKYMVSYRGLFGILQTVSALADDDGRVTMAIDGNSLAEHDRLDVRIWSPECDRRVIIRTWRIGDGRCDTPRKPTTNEEVPICKGGVCSECALGSTTEPFTATQEPTGYGVPVDDGAPVTTVPIRSHQGRFLDDAFTLYQQALTVCDTEMGQSWSHSYNMWLTQTGDETAAVVTPNLQVFPISRLETAAEGSNIETASQGAVADANETWSVPEGFYSRLVKDTALKRWRLTGHDGMEYEFVAGLRGRRGPLVGIREPNGNQLRVFRDASGFVRSVLTDLHQEIRFEYSQQGRVAAVIDHIGRRWSFRYAQEGNLIEITGPPTEYADIEAGFEITDQDLPSVLTTRGRTTTFAYDDANFPHHITAIRDDRNAVPVAYTYYHEGPNLGRVATKEINGDAVTYFYGLEAEAGAAGGNGGIGQVGRPAMGALAGAQGANQLPSPLPVLDPGNRITRVIDREGNVTDYETHGPAGGPIKTDDASGVGLGKFGLRRKVTWTEDGLGNEPLRTGEPLYWEQRWLHDCDCLVPIQVSQSFRSDDSLSFDENGMPVDYPTEFFKYNDRRQMRTYEYRGFARSERIRWEKTYTSFERFSRERTYKEPRAFDDHPIYAGLDFTHRYRYDNAGNRIRHEAPDVTRGVEGPPQVITESWIYNDFGQVTSHTDPDGNVTTYTYFTGPSSGGNINTKGEFGGYMASMTRGAEGSADPVTALTTRYKVNALGMTTQHTDPKGFVYDYQYNDLGEKVRELDAEVTLRNGQKVRYQTRHFYDGAGNRVLSRRSNVDVDGTVPANRFIDRSQSFDDVNNLLSSRVEIDGDDANDLITRYAYDGNDQLAVTEQPEGNRTFHVYDERRLRFKTFYGIAPSTGGDLTQAYPDDKRAEDLGGASFVGFTTTTYDARRNVVQSRDGRGNLTDHVYDFFNRRLATSDQNGNGMVYEYDDASNQLTHEGGAVSKASGAITQVLARSYYRYDEIGRRYQTVLDLDLESNERFLTDPDDGQSSSFLTRFDPGSRVTTRIDAEGNPTRMSYDAADRTLAVTDALGNVRAIEYDRNSNVVATTEVEFPGPGADGEEESYVTTYDYDELNRRTESHIRGLGGDSIDHATFYTYDSRSNTRLVEDAEANFTLTTFDDLDRVTMTQRFNGDPFTGAPIELIHYEYRYDRNSRKTHDIARSDVTDPDSEQATIYLYDDLDRLVTTVYPDADDFRLALNGPGHSVMDLTNPDGNDGEYDRVEVGYDANSNVVTTREQRGVEFNNTYDPGNRLTRQDIALPPEVPGTDRQDYEYDALNRLIAARNNYAEVLRSYDPLSRLTSETQAIRLDGSGFVNGWENPVEVATSFDRQSNRTGLLVVDRSSGATDLDVRHRFDALNRVDDIRAEYFDRPLHDIADYTYHGPWRVRNKIYGNGAGLTQSYDAKRRISQMLWTDGTSENNLLVGFEYDYDDVDNPLYERFLHDDGLYDNYDYNDRYELTGVTYRHPNPVDYRDGGFQFDDTFIYDDNFNRKEATFNDPFNEDPVTHDLYQANKVNEYTAIDRSVGGQSMNLAPPLHDKAGNMTRFPTRPAVGGNAGKDVDLVATWDAFNMMFTATVPDPELVGGELVEEYRYDPFRRRIARFDISERMGGAEPRLTLRRYIWEGWICVEERISEEDEVAQIPVKIEDRLERVYVNGQTIDEPLIAAIDSDNDGDLRGDLDQQNLPGGADFEYNYAANRLGSIILVLESGTNPRILEHYRYGAYGRATVRDGLNDANDADASGIMPLEFGQTSFAAARNIDADQRTHSSRFRNTYMFTGRRLDRETGLYSYRMRYADAEQGRLVSRDPMDSFPARSRLSSTYTYVEDRPTTFVDPLGLKGQWIENLLRAIQNLIPVNPHYFRITPSQHNIQGFPSLIWMSIRSFGLHQAFRGWHLGDLFIIRQMGQGLIGVRFLPLSRVGLLPSVIGPAVATGVGIGIGYAVSKWIIVPLAEATMELPVCRPKLGCKNPRGMVGGSEQATAWTCAGAIEEASLQAEMNCRSNTSCVGNCPSGKTCQSYTSIDRITDFPSLFACRAVVEYTCDCGC